MITCKICNRSFKSTRGLFGHVTQKHNILTKDYYDMYIKAENEGHCKMCGKNTTFYNGSIGYLKHCSASCSSKDPEVQQKLEQTNIDKYGVKRPYAFNSDLYKENLLSKYNVDNIAKDIETKNKIKLTNQIRYKGTGWSSKELLAKYQQTCLSKYGAINGQGGIGLQHTKETNLSKYGYTNVAQVPSIKQKIRSTLLKRNKISSYELYFSSKLDELNIDYIVEYKDDRYPYFCDFYIPKLDMYIELNISWVHGQHYFDINNSDDIAIYNLWKSKDSTYYKSAIITWTVVDIEKRDCAIKNDLNYVVLWSKQDIDSFIDKINKAI